MPVYVDEIRSCEPSQKWGWDQFSHMVADTPEELYEMARKIGLKMTHLQKPGTYAEHFDLTPGRRNMAIREGAREVSHRALVTVMIEKRRAMREAAEEVAV